jgi:hypothetical protein
MSSAERVSVPAGGVNAALLEYGDFVLSRHKKARAQGNHTREVEYLGYSGTAYYFYDLCDCVDDPRQDCEIAPCDDKGIAFGNLQAGTELRKTCKPGRSPIPPKYLQGAATPGTCSSYADTLIAVAAACKDQGIPIKNIQLTSYWCEYDDHLHFSAAYLSEHMIAVLTDIAVPTPDGEGWNNGVNLWEDIPQCVGNDTSFMTPGATPGVGQYPGDAFPLGIASFRSSLAAALGMPTELVKFWAHNGAFQPGSPYRRNASLGAWAPGPRGAPQGRQLWDHLFGANSRAWGLSTINQDHVGEQIGDTPTAYTNISVLKSWMAGMGEAAAAHGVNVMYCCAPPNVHMNGVTVEKAYMVRASPDYVWLAGAPLKVYPSETSPLPTLQWAIGPDSAFHWLVSGPDPAAG